MKKVCFVLALVVMASVFGAAQKLPETATPSHYQITFTPKFADNTFKGEETIDVRVLKPTKTIVLNASEIAFHDVTITAGKQTQKATVSLNEQDEMATLTTEQPVAAGAAQIKINFTGKLNSHLAGLYLSETKKRKYAVSQMEATDARRAFPSFDEPNYKATFDITAIVDKDDTAISNMKVASDTPGPGADKHTMKFATSPKMSTYLVALTVGDWKCVSDEVDGVPLRVCAVPGMEQNGKYALEATKSILHFFNQYYGIKYPFGKLDQIAVPDFQAGAMENTGAIIYRETLLLADEKTTSDDSKREIASVISHEIAHQWFGDLVTMKWWDDIWLNEGFATWMAPNPLEAWKPEWNVPVTNVADANESMNGDSVVATRPIRQAAETKAEINSLFDGIAYGKTAAVLRMLESYLGKDVFRAGVNSYLKAHAYGNATAEDFWKAMATAAKKPVDKIMPTFVTQPGVPFVESKTQCVGGNTNVTLTQNRYFYDPALMEKTSPQLWQIPVCMKGLTSDGKGTAQQCELMTQKEQTFKMNGCPAWVFPNAGGAGYYRYGYDSSTLAKMGTALETGLSPSERMSVVGNEWALVRSGQHRVTDYLALAEALKNDRTRAVVDEMLTRFGYIENRLLTDQTRPAFNAWARSYLGPMMKELGFEKKANEAPDQTLLRARVFLAAGSADDPAVIAKANELTQEALKGGSVDPTLLDSAVNVAARHGDAALYEQFRAKLKTASDAEEFYRYFYALGHFRQPELLQKTLEWALTPEVRNQDMGIINTVADNRYGRTLAWEFVKSHVDPIRAKQGGSIGAASVPYIGVAANFCDASMKEDATKYFESEKKARTPQRGFKSAIESINYCMEMRQRDSQTLAQWLQKNAGSNAVGGQK
jgi:aminopeptidase N